MGKLKDATNWLLPMFLIIFIAEIIVFPIAIGVTYAGRSENPNHTLTYKTGSLKWSDVEGIDENGVAQLSVFDAEYQNVTSDNGDKVIAPGTEGLNIIRLQNRSSGKVKFTAVVYSIKTNDDLPVEVSLKDGSFSDTNTYPLPEGVDKEDVIRGVKGTVSKNQIVDFDISWLWSFYVDDEHDATDVNFGDLAANGDADEVTVGFYLVIEDENGGTHSPETSDRSDITVYLTLLCISGAILLILFITRRHGERKE